MTRQGHGRNAAGRRAARAFRALRFLPAALALVVLDSPAVAQTPKAPVKIGIIGAGHIGGTLATLWVKAGHEVLISSRHPEALRGSRSLWDRRRTSVHHAKRHSSVRWC